MTQALRNTAAGPRTRKRTSRKQVVLFDQENATAVLRALQSLRPLTQSEIADAVNISQSAVSEWLAGRRVLTFERIPLLAELYEVDPMLFLHPVEDVEKTIKPFLASLETARKTELAKALAALAAMERKTSKPVDNPRLFEPSAPVKRSAGRSLQSVN